MISGISHTRIRRRAAAAAIALALASLTACTSGTTPGAGDNSSPPSGAWINGLSGLSAVRLTVADGTDAGAAKGRSLNLPAGWSGQVWANAAGARMAVWTPDGRLIISTGQNGSLALLTPTSRDRAPEVTTLAAGLDDPQGVAVTQNGGRTVLVAGEATQLDAWDYADGRLSNKRVLVSGLPAGGHASKMVTVHDGVVYYNVGSATNRDPSDRTSAPLRATVEQVRLDGSGHQIIARGVRNGEGLSFAPDGTLFAAINEDDNQPYPFRGGQFGTVVPSYVNDHPNDQVSRMAPGTDMGWPLCVPDSRGHDDLLNLPYVNDPVNNPDGHALDCGSIGRTLLGLPAHSAPVGFVFTRGSALPADLSNGALITAHGSWDRQPPRPPYVAYSAWDVTTRSLQPATVLVTGFQDADGSRWGRSVDAAPGPDGAIYVTDDTAGLVYRLTPGT